MAPSSWPGRGTADRWRANTD